MLRKTGAGWYPALRPVHEVNGFEVLCSHVIPGRGAELKLGHE